MSGAGTKVYKNGVYANGNSGASEPSVIERVSNSIGTIDGTIAYVKMWHGVELQQVRGREKRSDELRRHVYGITDTLRT